MQALKQEQLNLQENAIASSMLHRVGDATVRFALEENGGRRHEIPRLSEEDLEQLTHDFSTNPKETLAWARESLFAINDDVRLPHDERSSRLDRYLEAYIELTLKLDHAAHPPTEPRKINKGVPDYIPDGFVDMGGDKELDPKNRNREQILIDKKQVLENYKHVLKEIFMTNYSGIDLSLKKKHMAATLAATIYSSLPYNAAIEAGEEDLGGGKVKLGDLQDGVCRHQGLTFQILCQAVGIQSRVLKAQMDGVRHSTNMIRIDGEWRIFDVSCPDYTVDEKGQGIWHPGAYKVDAPPPRGGKKRYDVTGTFSGRHHVYDAHDDMYWYVDRPSD